MKYKDIKLPEIQEFLKVSRTFVRQLDIIKHNEIPNEYKDVVDDTVELVGQNIDKYRAS